ncbi:endoglucanase IV precursor [Lindgomyces ingoldianus]|uniref:Endoglucanase IV n=1 Tax=Lindgomyces ingoldianus TaxID=673940 RepID=A0ACB6QHU5_9PLEO|nr:endoglucanase IV precursor [Lindgomyces ingoldianus]KAF2466451.1 endoglucanase IV precursor [Lindgomyces ingoldianus]
MAPITTYLFSFAFVLPTLVNAHGHVTGIVADGKWYTGWNGEMKYQNPLPATAGWQADNLDNGFVTPDSFAKPDIICHKSAKNGNAYIPAKPGSKITFQWNTWPVSHKGPVFDYIASCNGDCTTVDKTKLTWVKMDEGAWLSGNDPGTWVTDNLIKSNISWSITLPNLAPGNYVIRHEIIALHAASQTNGAQAYPQCVNFQVSGGGTLAVSGGVPATSFYKASDPGIQFNLYSKFTGYTMPGPALTKLLRREEGEEREHARNWFRRMK